MKLYGSTNDDNDEDNGSDKEIAYCDHYQNSDDDNDNDDTAPLTGRTRRKRRKELNGKSSSSCPPCTPCPSFRPLQCYKTLTHLLLLPLLLLTTWSTQHTLQLQHQLTSLSSQFTSLSTNVTFLSSNASSTTKELSWVNDTLAQHGVILARFNNSISNSDVLHRLEELEEEWEEGEERVKEEMEGTKKEIQGVLEVTKKSIDDTVHTAQSQIQTQVQTVQSSLSSYIRTTQDQFSTENSFMIYQLAGTFTLLTCLISMWHMTGHLRLMRVPLVQRKVLAILWMCPIYGVTSWLSLVVPSLEGYLAIVKDLYEAYVIYQFLSFLIAVLGRDGKDGKEGNEGGGKEGGASHAVEGSGDREAVVELLSRHADHLSPPLTCRNCLSSLPCFSCLPWCQPTSPYGDLSTSEQKHQLAEDVLLQCQIFAMQFVFLRPFLTSVLFVLKKIGFHGPLFGRGGLFDFGGGGGGVGVDGVDGGVGMNGMDADAGAMGDGLGMHNSTEFDLGGFDFGNHDDQNDSESSSGGGGLLDYNSPQFYLVILENVSVFMAFSGLLKFYHAVQEDLSWCRPFPKFLCIKGVVFMTFWQGVIISLLADTTDLLGGVDVSEEDQEKWAKQAQNFLICLEMLGFSIAHFYCFPTEEWEEGYRPVEKKGKFGDNMALGDFVHDLKLILRHNEMKKRQKLSNSKLKSDDSIATVLEEDEELGHSISSEEGLQSLLDDVGTLLESQTSDTDDGLKEPHGVEGNDARSSGIKQRRSSPASPTTPSKKYQKGAQEYLAEKNAPKELCQATALLLQSSLLDEDTARLLTRDILSQYMEEGVIPRDDDGGEDQDENGEEPNKKDGDGEVDSKGNQSRSQEGDTDQGESVTESTELLTSSKNDDMLRPSIFTYVTQTSQEESLEGASSQHSTKDSSSQEETSSKKDS